MDQALKENKYFSIIYLFTLIQQHWMLKKSDSFSLVHPSRAWYPDIKWNYELKNIERKSSTEKERNLLLL